MNSRFEKLSATKLAKGLQDGHWLSVELTEYFLGCIGRDNPRTRAVVAVDSRQALERAEASDRRRARGAPLSAIDGLPMTVKDAFRLKGWVSTYGYWIFRGYRPKSDSRVIQVLREGGVVFLGRTVVPTASFDWNCRNQVYPECVNPYDPKRTPGGSSGGAAAALATGMTPLEIGSDLGGSIRYPAHCCGVYGLRTTDGWLPVGDFGPEGFGSAFQRIVTCGPMARSLEDLDLMLRVFEKAYPLPPLRAHKGGPLKIAFSRDLQGLPTDASTRSLLERKIDELRALGHTVDEASPELDWQTLYEDWGIISGHEYTGVIPALFRNRLCLTVYAKATFESRLGPGPFTTNFKRGLFATQGQYEQALRRRELIFKEVDRFFAAYDFWLLPVAASPAVPLALCGKKQPTANGDVDYVRYLGSYLVPTTMMGTPALACPIGQSPEGLPIGVQIHGPRFSDRQLIAKVAGLTALRGK